VDDVPVCEVALCSNSTCMARRHGHIPNSSKAALAANMLMEGRCESPDVPRAGMPSCALPPVDPYS
jgi:hypothetical protein